VSSPCPGLLVGSTRSETSCDKRFLCRLTCSETNASLEGNIESANGGRRGGDGGREVTCLVVKK
jgi:hypothetical protein